MSDLAMMRQEGRLHISPFFFWLLLLLPTPMNIKLYDSHRIQSPSYDVLDVVIILNFIKWRDWRWEESSQSVKKLHFLPVPVWSLETCSLNACVASSEKLTWFLPAITLSSSSKSRGKWNVWATKPCFILSFLVIYILLVPLHIAVLVYGNLGVMVFIPSRQVWTNNVLKPWKSYTTTLTPFSVVKHLDNSLGWRLFFFHELEFTLVVCLVRVSYVSYVEDNGEVDWLLEDAINKEIPIPVIAQSIMELFKSRNRDSDAYKSIALMRHGFGGHPFGRDEYKAKERKTDRIAICNWIALLKLYSFVAELIYFGLLL